MQGAGADGAEDGRFLQGVKEGRADALGTFDLLELEAVAPSDEGSPDELVGGDDDGEHDNEAPGDGGPVFGGGGSLKIAAETWKAEISGAEDKHFASDKEEPAAGNRNHAVPDKADGSGGELKLQKALPAGVAVNGRGFDEFVGKAFERGVEGEGHIPDLAGEDEDDGTELQTDLTRGEEGDHGKHDAGQEAENGDGLKDVERGDHDGFEAAAVSGDVAVSNGEDEAEEIGEAHAHEGVEGVAGKGAGRHGEADFRLGLADPEVGDLDDAVEAGEADEGDEDVEDEGPAAAEDLAAGEGLRKIEDLRGAGMMEASGEELHGLALR